VRLEAHIRPQSACRAAQFCHTFALATSPSVLPFAVTSVVSDKVAQIKMEFELLKTLKSPLKQGRPC
jgi:hypothetical protein